MRNLFLKKEAKEAGAVLLISLLLMVVLSLIAFAGVMGSLTELTIGKNYQMSREVFYPGDGGLEVLQRFVAKTFKERKIPSKPKDFAFTIGDIEQAVLYPREEIAEDRSQGRQGRYQRSLVIDDLKALTNQDNVDLWLTREHESRIVGRGQCIGGSIIFGRGETCQPFLLDSDATLDKSSTASSRLTELLMVQKGGRGF